jgi:hypothetical protein
MKDIVGKESERCDEWLALHKLDEMVEFGSHGCEGSIKLPRSELYKAPRLHIGRTKETRQ